MERIDVNYIKKGIIDTYIAFGVFFLIVSSISLISDINIGFDTRLFGGDWENVFFFIQGIGFVFFGLNIRNKNYFFEKDEKEIRYFLTNNKKVQHIEISSIESIKINTNTIIIISNASKDEIKLDLKFFNYDELKRIKSIFEEIKTGINK
ncbi:MAG: hypothetical protein GXX85_02200 [Ignavibacteria bacterium]|nr:hypothetical protein [Ignavibacteria bacterium]